MRGLSGDTKVRAVREKQNAIAIGILIIATIIALIALMRLVTTTPDDLHDASAITITGTTTCLPHKDASGPVTLECAIGLQGDDGRYYALQQLPAEFNSQFGRVHIRGTLTSPQQNETYDIAGSIAVTAIERQ